MLLVTSLQDPYITLIPLYLKDAFILAESPGKEDIQDIIGFPGILTSTNNTDYFCGVCVVHSQTQEDSSPQKPSVTVTWFGLGFPMYIPILSPYHHIHHFPLTQVLVHTHLVMRVQFAWLHSAWSPPLPSTQIDTLPELSQVSHEKPTCPQQSMNSTWMWADYLQTPR